MTQIKPQPTNVSAERAVLAGLCQHGSLSFTDVTEFLSVDCFSKPINQNIFRCLEETFKSSTKVDYPTIVVKAKEIGLTTLEDKTNQEYIVSLFNYPVEKETIKLNASSLKKLLLVRQAQNMIKDMYVKLGDMSGSEKLSEILSVVEEPIYEFSNHLTKDGEDKTQLLCEDVMSYIEYVSQNKIETVGIPSPWPRYNDAIGGGRRRDGVYMISARPKVGKSTLAINDAIHCANKLKIPTLYLDSEMSKEGHLPRILANVSKIPMLNIEKGRLLDIEIDNLKMIGKDIQNMPLYYRKISGMSFGEILSIARNFVMQIVGSENGATKDCMIIYDYFKLMDASILKSIQEYQALGFQIQELTDFCTKYHVPCAAYVQLNRQEEVAQSDRILWLVSSLAMLKRKSYEEMELDGFENGNTKLIVCQEQRYGPGLPDNDYINVLIQRDRCIVDEIGLKSEIDKDHQGFSDHDGDDDDESESF